MSIAEKVALQAGQRVAEAFKMECIQKHLFCPVSDAAGMNRDWNVEVTLSAGEIIDFVKCFEALKGDSK